ncbi:tyrosine-type recombinase/integrase [Nonomuraea sp. NPDC049141]|uniref:tyrosine-type recombinase/integrase n=1 Tax=Nonomuraea sp. NPDC049141 TaxID=3155500 RepID=UPI0033FD6589
MSGGRRKSTLESGQLWQAHLSCCATSGRWIVGGTAPCATWGFRTSRPAPTRSNSPSSTGQRWSRSKAYELVQRAAKPARVESKVTPHTACHTYALLAEEAGVPMRTIQIGLSHKDVSTTEIYTAGRDRLEKDVSQIVASAIE